MNYENDFGAIVSSEVNNIGPYWCTRKNTNDHAAKSVWLKFSGSYNFSSQILIVRFLDCLHSLVSQQRGTVSSLLCWHLLRKTHLKVRNNSGSLHRQKSHFYAIFFLALHKKKKERRHLPSHGYSLDSLKGKLPVCGKLWTVCLRMTPGGASTVGSVRHLVL